MPLIFLAVVAFLPLFFVALLPFSIVQRYRMGTARRLGRSWVATVNVLFIGFSVALFLFGAAVINVWVPKALLSAGAGLIGGAALGLLGLWLTHWERTGRSLHYTPNRPLVLVLTVAVAARLFYGFWRAWHAWDNTASTASWLAASGAAGSLAVGAIVLGYYFTFWLGVARRLKTRGRLQVVSIR